MNSKLLAAVLTTCLCAPAFAAPVTYTIDPLHTFERFSYRHMGFSTQQSRFNKTSGNVTLDAAAHTGSVNVTIDTTSVDSGSDLFNGHLRGADFFDVAQYPTATFKSTAVTFDGDRPVSVEGSLTIKGVTRPATLMVTDFKHGQNMMKRDAIGADATVLLHRSDFNMGKDVPMVGDDVTVTISFEASAK